MAFTTAASLNTGVRSSVEDIVAHTDNVGHNSVSEVTGTERSNSVTEEQNSVTEGQNSVTTKQNSGTEEPKFKWKSDGAKSEWIRKLELGLDSPACYDLADRVLVMKLPDFKRKPVEHYTPQQWRFGLHNRDLQASTTVASTTESEDLKISLAAACNLKSDRWEEFCDNVVDDPKLMVLRSYCLHPSVATNFSRKEVQSLLTLDALTLLLVLSSLLSPDSPDSPEEKLFEDFILWLETGGLKIRALLKDGVAYNALWNDLFLFENQIPMDLLNNVISKCYLLPKGQNSYSDTFQDLKNPQSSLRKKFLHKILRNLVCRMCIEIFVKPDRETLSHLIEANYPVGSLEDCAHIFACVYKILTTFPIEEESSTTTKSLPDEDKTKGVHIFAFVYKILTTFHIKKESSTATISLLDEDKTKESASDREQLPHATSFGNSPTVLDVKETSPIDLEQPGDCEVQMSRIPEAEHDLEQPGDCEVQMSRIPEAEHDLELAADVYQLSTLVIQNKPGENPIKGGRADAPTVEKQLCCPQNPGEETLRSATDLKKAGLRIEGIPGMIKAVAFKDGCLSLPVLQLHDNTESYFRNLAMYEVYGRNGENSNAFSDYLQLMLELIKTEEDVAYLVDDCNVIRNLLVTHQNVFKMWERLQSGIDLPPYSKKFKTDIVIPVNRKCKSRLRQMRTEFYNTFCSKPWLAISVITAVVLLLATLIQTYVSVIGSDKMQPHFPRGG
jgi:hypothetical protein